jgi:hypothetical protein
MDAFSHLSVLISIILGLAITQLLQGFRGIVLERSRVRIYWVPIAWAAIVLVACVQSWWAMFGLRGVREWTFPTFAVVLLQVIATYMQAALVLPDFSGDAPVDLLRHFQDHLRWFFASVVLTLLASLAKDVALTGHLPAAGNLAFHVALIAASIAASATTSKRYHAVNVVAAGAAVGAYVVLLFMRLQ